MPFKSMHTSRKRRARTARKRVRRPRVKRTLNAFKGIQQIRRGVNVIPGNQQFIVSAGASFGPQNDSWTISNGIGNNVAYISAATYYTADMIPGGTSGSRQFIQMFDQYKVRRIQTKITPYSLVTSLQSGNISNQYLSVLFHDCLDWDDATPFTADAAGIDKMRQRKNYRVRNLFNSSGKPITRSFTPHIAEAAFSQGIFTAYANKGPTWIDSNSPGVQHYGYKWIMELFSPDNTQAAYVWFKNEAFLTIDVKDPI